MRESISVLEFTEPGEAVISTTVFEGLLIVATSKRVYAHGDIEQIKKIFPHLKGPKVTPPKKVKFPHKVDPKP